MMNILFYAIIVLILVITYFYAKGEYKRRKIINGRTKTSIPGTSNPLYVPFKILIKSFPAIELMKEYGNYYPQDSMAYLNIFGYPFVILKDIESVQHVLKNYRKFPKMNLENKSKISRFFGRKGILYSNDIHWKEARRTIDPVFSKPDLFSEYMIKKSDELVEHWRIKRNPIIVGKDIQSIILDLIGLSVFGNDFDFFGGKEEGPIFAYNRIMKTLKSSYGYLLSIPIINKLPLNTKKRMSSDMNEFDIYIQNAIDNYKNDEKKENRSLNMLDLLIEANSGDKLTQDAIRDNLLTFFVGGHEPTATAIHYLLYNLAKYPEMQEKLRDDVNRIFPTDDIDVKEFNDFSFIEFVIKENLRLHPPTSLQIRKNEEDEIIGDYCFPKGVAFQISILSLMYDKDIWGDDVDSFVPERFNKLTEEQKDAYIPFGGEKRICIGMNFSILTQKIFLIKFLKAFRISLTSDSKLETTFSFFHENAPKNDLLKFNFENLEKTQVPSEENIVE